MTLLGDNREEALKRISKWEAEGKHGFSSDDTKDMFMNGDLSDSKAIAALKDFRGYDTDTAIKQVAEWKYEREYPDLSKRYTYSEYTKWETNGKPKGVSFELYAEVYAYRDDGTSESAKSQDEVWAYIDSMNISKAQKDAIHLCFWKESTLKNAPWH